MGPTILKKQGKETKYSLRLLPIGGFCAMEGEDEDTEDPRGFAVQKIWKKFIILFAGSASNFIVGLIIVFIVFSGAQAFGGNTVAELTDDFKYGGEAGIMEGDRIVEIDGNRIFYSNDFRTYMSRSNGKSVDLVIERDGQKIRLEDFPLKQEEYIVNGQPVTRYGITFNIINANAGEKIKYSLYSAYNYVRLVEMGLADLISGVVGIDDMSGVVGIVSVINDVGESSENARAAAINISNLAAFIAINLAVMNLLPIPALDGGRIFFLAVTWVIEKIIRRKIDPKYEGYIHAVGLFLLIGLMVYIMFNDVVRIING